MNRERLTEGIKQFAHESGIDIFGIADIELLNQKARPGRRPSNLFPMAKAILIFGCGMAEPLARAWVCNGKGGEYLSLTLCEVENRKWKLKEYLRNKGYHTYGGEILGGGILDTGIRLANAAVSCGLGYIGKNNMLITKKYGPRVNLLYLTTDAPLIPEYKVMENECGECRVCEKFCTSGAILGDEFFHARQCESIVNCLPNKLYFSKYLNMDCDMCQRMCPKGDISWPKEETHGNWWDKLERLNKSGGEVQTDEKSI